MRRRQHLQNINKVKTLVRLEKLLLSGVTNRYELAAAFGVDPKTIERYIKQVEQQWRDHPLDEQDERRWFRIRQLENLAVKALNSYELSKKPEESFGTETRRCSTCKGKKVTINHETDDEQTCIECEGTGQVTTETERTRGQAGDASFLRVAKECFSECAKLEGLHPQGTSGFRLTQSAQATGDGTIIKTVEELYYSAPPETIIRAKAALAELKAGIKNGTIKVADQSTIDTTATDVRKIKPKKKNKEKRDGSGDEEQDV